MNAPTLPPDAATVPQRKPLLAFLPIAIALTMAVLDGAIVNIALPSIAQQLSLQPEQAIWIVNIYNLAITISLLPLSSLGDSIGYRRVYWWGLLIFTFSSLLCANAGNFWIFIVARFLQGLGAAGIMSVNIALVRFIFPKAKLGAGMGYTALIVAVSAAAGPSVGAAILSVADWQWLFLVNVPSGVFALILARQLLPLTPTTGTRISKTSILLNALTFGPLIAGLNAVSTASDHRLTIILLIIAFVAGTAFIAREQRMVQPILPLDLLKRPIFRLSFLISITSFSAQNMGFVALPFYLETALGYSAHHTGFLLTPWPMVTALIAPVAGRLSDRFPPHYIASLGLLLFAIGWASLALLPAGPGELDLVWRFGLCGLGFGMMQSPNNRVIIGSAPPERSGGASGLQSLGRLLGQSLGAIIVATLFSGLGTTDIRWVAWTAAALAITASAASLLRKPVLS
ncbi:MFS transporter [Aestuariivirga sp.]|uniref:MFS transporter n=1 Tax=Aestuariivirga sp. TaxID=2650926 RepID=UPI0039E354CE